MLDFAKSQNETIAIVADAVDRFQRSFKESVLIDELIRKEQMELHFYRENMIIGSVPHPATSCAGIFQSWARNPMC